MTTLQTGTKVLIEATVDKIDSTDCYVKTKAGDVMWIRTSDLTVCETAKTIDLQNFCIDITDPVNAELLPGFKEWFNNHFNLHEEFSGHSNFYGSRWGGPFASFDNWIKNPLTTLPELQKQHPGVFGETKLVDLTCMGCGKSFKGEEPKMCCSGKDCGCMGQPIDPIICSEECYYKLPHMRSKAIPTPSFKAGQEVEFKPKHGDMVEAMSGTEWRKAIYCCPHPNPNSALKHILTETDSIITWSSSYIRPIPAQPTVESDNKLKCTDCGAPMNEGERKTFTCCDECWNKTYVHSNMAETKINTEVDELKDMLTNCKFTIQDILAWHQKHSGRVEKDPLHNYNNCLHEWKFEPITQTERCFKCNVSRNSGRVEVSVPSDEEIERDGKERGLRDNELQLWWEGAVWMRNFMTRKEQQG